MSLYIRYLHMQVGKEAMWDGPLPNFPLCPSSSKGANEHHHCCWRWPQVTSIPASSRLDLRTYRRISWVGMSYYIGLKRMVHWSTETLHIPICPCVKRIAFVTCVPINGICRVHGLDSFSRPCVPRDNLDVQCIFNHSRWSSCPTANTSWYTSWWLR